jgi:hypothetical protein
MLNLIQYHIRLVSFSRLKARDLTADSPITFVSEMILNQVQDDSIEIEPCTKALSPIAGESLDDQRSVLSPE